ncbi:hypothetical protein KAU09_03560 [Candidatus Parcubacteria bacterium]|nr:hypothetical protein [Candidatus Parcubacteria bacterium]
MQKLRKALVVSVMAITVLSLSVLSVPLQVDAAAQAGDLIKMDGLSSVYYLAADGKRYVFPNEATYFSWYGDFSGVVTIPQSELESYSLGANVTVRPGTKLIKITTDPKVYAVEPNGNLVHIPDEATAITLYGADWAARVVDIADAFFTNYNVTGNQTSATAYPTGTLVDFGGTGDVSYIDADGNARKIADEASFLANRFKWGDVIVSTLTAPTAGTEVAGAEEGMTDTSSGAGGTAGAGTGLTVALASDTPAAGNIPDDTPVEFLKFNLTAASDGDVTVNSVIITAYDLGNYDNIENVTLYSDGIKISSEKDINSDGEATINLSSGFLVAAGTTESLTVRAEIDDTSGNFALGLASASDIVTNGAVVSGSFPIIGNTKAIVDVTIGDIEIDGFAASPVTEELGEEDILLADFNLDNEGNEDVIWESARIENKDDAGVAENVKLYIEGDEVADATLSGDFYVFDIGNYLIEEGDNIDVEVRGDIGVTDTDDTFNLQIDEMSDFSFMGQRYGYGIEMADDDADLSTGIAVTLETGEVTIAMDESAQDNEVRSGTDNVVLAVIQIVSNSEDATIEEIDGGTAQFIIEPISGTVAFAELEDIELHNVDGGTYDVDAGSALVGGNWELDIDEDIFLPVGEMQTFELLADITDDMDDGVELQVTLEDGAFTITGEDSDAAIINISPSSIDANEVTIEEASFEMVVQALTDESVVGGALDVLIFEATLEAGDSSEIELRSITLDAEAGSDAFDDDDITDLRLMIDGEELEALSSESSMDGTAAAYITFNSLDSTLRVIPAGDIVTLQVYADIDGDATAGSFALEIDAVADIDADDEDGDDVVAGSKTINTGTVSRDVTIAETGTLKVELKIDDTAANNDVYILAGTETVQDRYLGELVFVTEYEPILVETLVLEQTGTADSGDIKYVVLYDETGAEVASKAPSADGHVNFSSFDMEFAADESTSLFLGVVTKGINVDGDATATASSSATIKFEIADDTALAALSVASDEAVTAKGVESNETLDIASTTGAVADNQYAVDDTSNEATLAGAVLTSVVNVMDDGILTGGTPTIAKYKFVFDNGSNRTTSNEELKAQLVSLTLTIATSTGVGLEEVRAYIEGDSANKTATGVDSAAGEVTIVLSSGLADSSLVDGEVTLVITADVTGIDENNWLQTEIDDLSADFTYNGNNGENTDDFSDALLDITEVIGAYLSN